MANAAAARWSAKYGTYIHGEPRLHYAYGMIVAKGSPRAPRNAPARSVYAPAAARPPLILCADTEHRYDEAMSQLLLSTEAGAEALAAVLVEWSAAAYPSEADLLLTRAVLQ